MAIFNDWILMWYIFLLHAASFVHGTDLNDNLSEVQSRYHSLFNTLNGLNFTTYNMVRLLRDNLDGSSLSSHSASDQQCLDGLDEYFQGLLDERLWALKMLDASSKFPTGILLGSLTDLGSYEECLSIENIDGPVQFNGQHCMISLLVDLAVHTFEAEVSKTKGLTVSLCLPSTCSLQFLTQRFDALGKDVNYLLNKIHRNETVNFHIDDTSCHIQQDLEWIPGQILGTVLTLLLICAILKLNLFDFLFIKNVFPEVSLKRREFVGAFSLASNWKMLTNTDTTNDTIQVLYGLKFLSIVWVCFAHRIKLCVQSPLIGLSLIKIAQYLKLEVSIIVLNATLAVEVFFLISGILNAYTYFDTRRLKNKGFLSHLKRCIKRYMRLTPAYATMVLVTSTWLYRVGDGPLWDQTMKPERDKCVKYWWTNLLYINNYYDPVNSCMIQSWYISAELQLFLGSIIILYPLWRWPKAGLINTIFFLILSIVIQFVVVYTYEIKTPLPFTMNKARLNLETAVFYTPTHTRLTAYLVGLLCGYGVHLIKRKKVVLKIKPYQSAIVWFIAFLSTSWALFGGHHLFELHSPYSRLDSSIYISLFRFCWSIGIAWIVIACTTHRGGVVNSILSWKIWMPLGRLSYGIYLIHVTVTLYTLGTLREPQYFNGFNIITGFGGEFIVTIFFAVALALLTELPVSAVTSLLTRAREDETGCLRRVDSARRASGVLEMLY